MLSVVDGAVGKSRASAISESRSARAGCREAGQAIRVRRKRERHEQLDVDRLEDHGLDQRAIETAKWWAKAPVAIEGAGGRSLRRQPADGVDHVGATVPPNRRRSTIARPKAVLAELSRRSSTRCCSTIMPRNSRALATRRAMTSRPPRRAPAARRGERSEAVSEVAE